MINETSGNMKNNASLLLGSTAELMLTKGLGSWVSGPLMDAWVPCDISASSHIPYMLPIIPV